MLLIRCKVDPVTDDGWGWMDLPVRCLCHSCRKKWAKLDRMAAEADDYWKTWRTKPLNAVRKK